MHILIAETTDEALKPMLSVTKAHVARISKRFPQATVEVADSDAALERELPHADILIALNLDAIDFSKARNLKWIHVQSAGVTIPDALGSHIIVTNSSGVHPIPVAEHVLGCMLMFGRRLHTAYRIQVEEQRWRRHCTLYDVSELHGKAIAIVGFGRIGKRIAELARAFGMRVLAVVRTVRKEPAADAVHGLGQLDSVLAQADYAVCCLPLTRETRGLFAYQRFAAMKPSAYFINVGRGSVAVERDLVRALREKRIAGAALDVFEKEPLQLSELWNLKNVIITPHISGWTPYYMDRVIDIFLLNAKAFVQNKSMPNLVDKEAGY